jgi:hypothetical protein
MVALESASEAGLEATAILNFETCIVNPVS